MLLCGLVLAGALGSPVIAAAADSEPVDFQRQVRPILSAKCFTCHGPDETAREADLRLDQQDAAVEDRGGYAAIRPGDHRASELWQRIVSEDDDLRMPPDGPHEPLTPAQIETLQRWIDQGAVYQPHWAFVPPLRSPIPLGDAFNGPASASVSTAIDAFINQRLSQVGLDPSPPADRLSLVRRLYLDLIGIPPTPSQADEFVADDSPLAYQRLVDSLLASPQYAERWARPWLDLARYADTNGYEKDRPRTIWPYRDWVLSAINQDMPLDAFSIRQLAGDMLPDASPDDHIATGFHRNTMINEEGGIDPEEFRFHAMTDRVATTGTVWMGLTIGCAQCHTHKYDPITHTDYYALFALLNGADDIEREVSDPATDHVREQKLAEIRSQEETLIREFFAPSAAVLEQPRVDASADTATGDAAAQTGDAQAEKPSGVYEEFWQYVRDTVGQAADWKVVVPSEMSSTLPKLRVLDDGSILASGDVTKRDVYTLRFDPLPGDAVYTGIRLEALPHESLPAGGPGMAFYEGRRGDFFLSELQIQQADDAIAMRDASASFGKISIGSGSADAGNVIDGEGSTGWSTSGAEGQANRWVANFAKPFRADAAWTVEMIFERHFAAPLGRFRISLAVAEPRSEQTAGDAASSPLVALPLDADAEARLLKDRRANDIMIDSDISDDLQRHFLYTHPALAAARKPLELLQRNLPEPVRTLVMRQRPPDEGRVTQRYHRGEYLHPGEQIQPAIPSIFASSAESMPGDRYELAQWLVSPANPLFARVSVDRAWRELFGRGIVDTAGDYGTQSDPPSHPELLDYLATEFINGGMSMKRLHRELVLSDAYQRSSHARREVIDIDPQNRLRAVGPRRRLEGERIRDSLLTAAGLLTSGWGGPSVFPPQPESVTAQAYGKVDWTESTERDRYRRSIYTFAKRTAPFAALSVFDGPTGETCLPRRDSSNSPLQALTLLNDAMFIEMAQALADDVRRQSPEGDPQQWATEMFRRLVARPPSDEELRAILQFRDSLDVDDPASWMLVARALMNLDEVITTP